jgi:ATP-dependent DNA helicase RecQ
LSVNSENLLFAVKTFKKQCSIFFVNLPESSHSVQNTIKQILSRYWGYQTFRPMQDEIILSVLEGRDTLALLPTGGGKSITFQVPALASEGVCIVITPLIALMKDQVANLDQKGIKAKAIFSGMQQEEIRFVLNLALNNEIKFLYISPERAVTEMFRNFYRDMKVCLLAVDESHCISQWGYDFRPPYLKIAELRQYHPRTPVLAVTATATPEVVEDIQEKLEFREKNVFRKSFYRRNLTYEVYRVEDKLSFLLEICNLTEGTGIVYVRNRKKTRELAEFLIRNKISSDFYHAGLSGEDRDRKQYAWTSGRIRIIVATNAFGMGIDKPDVRIVVHMDLPDCIEAYFQEAGRAGRDEKSSRCVLLYNQPDIAYYRKQIEKSFPPKDFIKQVYFLLGNFLQLAVGAGHDVTFDFDIASFTDQYELDPVETFYALQILEKQGLILMSEAIHSPSRIRMAVPHSEIYKFRVEHPPLDPFVQMLLRSYPGLFNEYVRIDERRLAKQMEVEPEKVLRALRKLDSMGLISYLPFNDTPKVTFLTSRIDERGIFISREIYEDRKQRIMDRFESMTAYVTSTAKCRSMQLLNYFGEANATRCGVCDVCLDRNELKVNNMEFNSFVNTLKPKLREKPLPMKEIYRLFSFEQHQKLSEVLRYLFDNRKISMNDNGFVTWSHKD